MRLSRYRLRVSEILKAWPRRVDTDYLFAGPSGVPLTTIRTVWKALCRRAKVADARFHDLRHTLTTPDAGGRGGYEDETARNSL